MATTPQPQLKLGQTLEQLSGVAFARFGEGSPTTADGDAYMLTIDFANEVIDDLHSHPYWHRDWPALDYYVHPSERRPLPDGVLTAGLLYRVARQQGSKKANAYEGIYYAKLNQSLMLQRFGNGAEFVISAVDMPAPSQGS